MAADMTASMTVTARRGADWYRGVDPFVGDAVILLMENGRAAWNLRWVRHGSQVGTVVPYGPGDVVDAGLYLALAAIDRRASARFDHLVGERDAACRGRERIVLQPSSAEDRAALIEAFARRAIAVCWTFASSSLTAEHCAEVAASAGFVHTRMDLPAGPGADHGASS